jgi:prevent-host-death family protein
LVKNTWQLQEAKNRLSTVVDNALTRGPQTITRHGIPAVVVVAAREFQHHQSRRKSIVELFEPARGLNLSVRRDKAPTRTSDL